VIQHIGRNNRIIGIVIRAANNAAVDMNLKDVASDIIRVTRIVWRSDSMMLLVRDRESALAVPIEISLGNIEEFNRK